PSTRNSAATPPVASSYSTSGNASPLNATNPPGNDLLVARDAAPKPDSAVDPDRFTNRLQHSTRPLTGLARACRQILVEIRARLDEFLVTLTQRAEFSIDDIEQLILQLSPPDAARGQPAAGIGHDLVGSELLQKLEHRRGIGILGFLDRGAVGRDPADQLFELLLRQEQRNSVVIGFAHLPAIESRQGL